MIDAGTYWNVLRLELEYLEKDVSTGGDWSRDLDGALAVRDFLTHRMMIVETEKE